VNRDDLVARHTQRISPKHPYQIHILCVSRAVSSIVFAGEGNSPLLVLGGDECIFCYKWVELLEVLQGKPGQTGESLIMGKEKTR